MKTDNLLDLFLLIFLAGSLGMFIGLAIRSTFPDVFRGEPIIYSIYIAISKWIKK